MSAERSVPPPSLRTSRDVLDAVKGIHGRPQDFDEGDLAHRLDRFSHYVEAMLPLSAIRLSEWDLCDDLVSEYAELSAETRPPVVFDAVAGSMIDGIHRANAAAQRGETEVRALIGLAEHLNPDWSPEPEDEEDDSLDEDVDEPEDEAPSP